MGERWRFLYSTYLESLSFIGFILLCMNSKQEHLLKKIPARQIITWLGFGIAPSYYFYFQPPPKLRYKSTFAKYKLQVMEEASNSACNKLPWAVITSK